MSASKKKRMGSQRRSLNPKLQESVETSDTAKSPPVPQGRQRADAVVDLTLNSAQSEIPVRKKLSSKRGNKEKLHFKDVTTESSHKPLEEVEDTTYSQAPDTLGIQNENIDESLEKDSAPGCGSADFDLTLNEPSNVSTSTITEATSSMPQRSDILDTDMEIRSDVPLTDDQNKKYLTTIVSTQEGVLTEKDLTQQMSDILEATLPAGVTGQSTCPVGLIEQEDINILGSHDSQNKPNAGGDEAGHIEKPVYQQSDESSLPIAKIRKLGSSRRRKDTNISGLHQGHEMVKESNIAVDVLEKTDLTIVQNTPPDDTYRVGQLDQTDNNDLFVTRNLQDIKNIEEPQVGQLLADFKDQEGEETKPNDCEKVIGPQDLSELSATEIPPLNDTIAPQSSPHPDITVSVGVEEAKILEIGDCSTPQVLEEIGEPAANITIEDFFATEEKKERVENKFKDETLVSSSVSSEIPFDLDRETSITEFMITKDDMVSEFGEPMLGAQIGTQSPAEELLSLNSDLLNVSAIPKPEDKNKTYAAQMEDERQVTSSVSVTDGDKHNSSVDPENIDYISACKNVDLIEQQETLITFIDEVGTVPGEKGEKQEEDVKLGDESQILNKEDTITPPNTSLDDVCDESDEHITPEEFLNRETIAAVVQEATLISDTYPKENVNTDLFDTDERNKEIDETIESSGSELDLLLHSKDEAVTEPIGEQPGIHATATELHNKEYNVPNVTTRPEIDVSHVDDVYQMVSSTVNVTHEGVDDNSAGLPVRGGSADLLIFSATNSAENERDESGSAKNVLSEQQPEPQIGFTLSTDPSQEDQEEMIKPADEELTDLQSDKSSEPQEPQIQQTDDTNASPTSPRPEGTADVQDMTTVHSQFIGNRRKLGSSRRIKGRKQANDEAEPEEKSEEILTPVMVTEETQIEPVHHEQGQISATGNEEHEDKVDKSLSQLVYDEPWDTVEETHNEAILSSEDLLQVNKKEEVPQQEQSSPASKDGQSEDNMPKKYVEEEKLTVPDEEIVQIQEIGLEKEEISDQYSVLTPHTDNMKEETEEEQTVEDNASKNGNILPNINDNVIENVVSEQSKVDSLFRQDSLSALQNTEVKTGIYALKEPINVHQLTYISDNEAHEEIDNSFLQQAEQPVQGETIGEPSKAVPLVDVTEVNKPNADHDHGPRRKLGSSRRTKARKPELTTANELSNESKVIGKVTEFVLSPPIEDLPQQELNNPDFASEVAAKLTSENDTKPQDTIFLVSDKEQSVNSEFQEKENTIQEKSLTEEIQKEVTAGQGDSFAVKDLKENTVAEADSTCDANSLRDDTKGGSEETVNAKIEDTVVVMFAEDKPEDQQEVQHVKVLATTAELQINSGKMASTGRSQLDGKQQDDERQTEDSAAISDSTTAIHQKEIITTVSEEPENVSSDIFVKQEQVGIAAVSPVEQPDEASAERQKEAQKDEKEEVLQTEEAALIEAITTGATRPNLQPVTSEAIPPSSPGKRRKMGSTRKNLTPKKQSPSEESVTLINVGKGVVSSTSDENNESEKHAENVSSDIFVTQKKVGIAAVSPVEQPDEASAERQKEAQKDEKEEVLQTEEAALVEGITTGATTPNLQPVTSEAIPPSSPGKRRKMGSTRKNLTPKKESPSEQSVTLINVGKDAVSSTSDENNESEKHDGILAHAASVHQQPPDEETPNSQQDDHEKLRSDLELEVSSHPHPDVMTEEAAIARRRKMGSHRKPHTDQSIKQGQDSEENLLHPKEERRAESPKLGQISEVNERDNKAFSTASAFNIKGDSRPVGQKIPQQLSQPSTNVRRAQQSNIRLAAGYDLSASKYEVVMIGDSSVGKTSFIQRAQSGRFSQDIPASIGMDSYKWTVVVDGRTLVLHLWDTAGQERFRSMTKQLLHRAQAFLLMYDITCAQTFTAVSYWASCIKDVAGENVVTLLLGNKSDSKERKVRREEGENLAQENGFAFIECSAATGENVIEALETVARLLNQKTARREEPLELRKPEPRNKGCC